MTTSKPPQTRSGSTLRRIFVVLGVLMLGFGLIGCLTGAMIVRGLTSAGDHVDVRSDILKVVDVSRNVEVQANVPAWLMTLGRVGGSIADAPPEVLAGLQSLHSGNVGVYELTEPPDGAVRIKILERADARLAEEGQWNRIVTVLQPEGIVAVYMLDAPKPSTKTVQFVVIVLDHRDLVIVSARAYTEPIVELASCALRDTPMNDVSGWMSK